MNDIFQEERFNILSSGDRAFILAFDEEMVRLGYDFGGKIGSGYCWGKYMIIYIKSGVKSKKVFARIYIRESGVVLRLFLNDIDRHRAFIERAPAHIKDVFVGPHGDCQHDRDEPDGQCRFKKTYTIDQRLIEKCNGVVFEFPAPSVQKLEDYITLFTEFYPQKRVRTAVQA